MNYKIVLRGVYLDNGEALKLTFTVPASELERRFAELNEEVFQTFTDVRGRNYEIRDIEYKAA